jgi:xanthine dehydrogenase accessory factor
MAEILAAKNGANLPSELSIAQAKHAIEAVAID